MSLFGSLYDPSSNYSNPWLVDHRRYKNKYAHYKPSFEPRHRPSGVRAHFKRSKPDPNAPRRRSVRIKERTEKRSLEEDDQGGRPPIKKPRLDPPPRPGLAALPHELILDIASKALGLCTLRRNSAALIQTLPSDPTARYAAVMALPTVDNKVPPSHQPRNAISQADRRKYRRFRQILANFGLTWHQRPLLAPVEKQWLNNFPLDILELDAFLTGEDVDLRAVGGGPSGTTTHGTPRGPIRTLALALHPLDVHFHRMRDIERLEDRLLLAAGAAAANPYPAYAMSGVVGLMLRALPASITSITLVAPYYTTTSVAWPGGAPSWDRDFQASQVVREGGDVLHAAAFTNWVAANLPGVEVVVAKAQAAAVATAQDWDTWAWI